MGVHEAPDAILNRFESDYARRRALELVAAADTLNVLDPSAVAEWVGSAQSVLAELARG